MQGFEEHFSLGKAEIRDLLLLPRLALSMPFIFVGSNAKRILVHVRLLPEQEKSEEKNHIELGRAISDLSR